MDIILKSGHVIRDVKSKDSTKSPIALWKWALSQPIDNVLGFDKLSVLSSQIAAITHDENWAPPQSDLDTALNQIEQSMENWRKN